MGLLLVTAIITLFANLLADVVYAVRRSADPVLTDHARDRTVQVHRSRSSIPERPAAEDYEVALESLNQWQIAWRKFKRHRLALIGAVIFWVMILLAIFGPIIWPYDRLDLKAPPAAPPGWLRNPPQPGRSVRDRQRRPERLRPDRQRCPAVDADRGRSRRSSR